MTVVLAVYMIVAVVALLATVLTPPAVKDRNPAAWKVLESLAVNLGNTANATGPKGSAAVAAGVYGGLLPLVLALQAGLTQAPLALPLPPAVTFVAPVALPADPTATALSEFTPLPKAPTAADEDAQP